MFFTAYAVYFIKELGAEGVASDEALDPLKFQSKKTSPDTWAVVLQTLATLAVIFGASQVFVTQLEWAGPAFGLTPSVVALLLSPIATELPEIMNAIIWIRQRKVSLALANISGAMMIQVTVPSGIGIIFTKWNFDDSITLAGVVTLVTIAYLVIAIRLGRFGPRSLLAAALGYVAFAIGLVALN